MIVPLRLEVRAARAQFSRHSKVQPDPRIFGEAKHHLLSARLRFEQSRTAEDAFQFADVRTAEEALFTMQGHAEHALTESRVPLFAKIFDLGEFWHRREFVRDQLRDRRAKFSPHLPPKSRYHSRVETSPGDHYATLGLDRRCTAAQIRAAYRVLAKRHHPDVNDGCDDAAERTRALNEAHEVLIDPARRRSYDRDLAAAEPPAEARRTAKLEKNVTKDAHLRIEDFIRGSSLEIRVNDPANPNGAETYRLEVPAGTAPSARFRVPRDAPFEDGYVLVRVRALPGFRFKVRGSDLRCDLRIDGKRAARGGSEMLVGPTGGPLRVTIPPGVGRGEILRVPGEGMPKPRGGRGDLLVRVTYRPEVRISRA